MLTFGLWLCGTSVRRGSTVYISVEWDGKGEVGEGKGY